MACVVIKAPRFSTSLPLLKQLHCLLVVYRTKLATIMYWALSTQQPPYLVSFLHFTDIPRNLRSSVPQQLFVPKTNIDIDKCAFSAWQHGFILSHMQISRLENKQTKQAPSYDESVYFIQYRNYTMIIS